MVRRDNSTGRPLAEATWLDAHHRAKLSERWAFAKRLARLEPQSIVDLGCATGLWLEILNEVVPRECAFIAIDTDESALSRASQRASTWSRSVDFMVLDIETEAAEIPPADLTLAFNIFSYVNDLRGLIESLAARTPRGLLAVRQYDGASIRFGPMPTDQRQQMEIALRTATEQSQHFKHYDMDRTIEALRNSTYTHAPIEFELFARASPFPEAFREYYEGTLEWTLELLSEVAAKRLRAWIDNEAPESSRYFYEVDLVSLLS